MKITTNENLIKRNRRIGQITTISSLVVLAGGLYLSFQNNSQLVTFSFLALLVGFLLSQIGIFYGNRWGRSPRPDEILSAALKGLEDKFTLYHYTTPVSHLIVGPAGLWVLIPYAQGGTITYEKGRWRQKGGNLYLKIFAQESLGRPDLEVTSTTNDIQRYLAKKLPDIELPEVKAALVFTNDKATVNIEDAPVPTLHVSKLKDFMRKQGKSTLSPEKVALLESTFESR